MGVQGAKPPGGGSWGMCPHKTIKGGELPTLATKPRVGPKTPANPKPTGVGKRESRGRSPLAGGCGGCAPFRPNPLTPFPAREGGEFWRWRGSPLPAPGRGRRRGQPRHEWDPKLWQTLSQRGWGTGVQGAKPPGGGSWGCPPTNSKEGASCPH